MPAHRPHADTRGQYSPDHAPLRCGTCFHIILTVKRLAIVGMPNTGKSTFFNRLTGSSARVGNWPGVTVDLLTARIVLGGQAVP